MMTQLDRDHDRYGGEWRQEGERVRVPE
jgi:hypothetical protein